MMPAPAVLGFLRPGGVFLLCLAAVIGAGLAFHAVLLRRFGPERLDRATRGIEGGLFCLFLGVMIALAGLQVFLRNFFHTGLLWIDPLVRTLVLWVAFIGALTATSQGRHLHIDAIVRHFSTRSGRRVTRLISAVAAVCCAFLANGAFVYLLEESGHGTRPFLGVSSWAAQSILLWGFILLCYRFFVQVLWPSSTHPPTDPASHP